MGVYVAIRDKNTGRQIIEGKYGVGYPILMFSNYTRNGKHVVFEASGKEAIKNIDEVMQYIDANMTEDNNIHLRLIKSNLFQVQNLLNANSEYVLDYSEIMLGVDNPSFDPMFFIQEFRNKLEDAIHGYSEVGMRNKNNDMVVTYLKQLSEEIHVSTVVKDNEAFAVFSVSVLLNEDDKQFISKSQLSDPAGDDFDFRIRYAKRKLFYILHKTPFKFEICERHDNFFYVIIDKQSIAAWIATKPYVECSYRFHHAFDNYFLVKNTPEELEKFYCYAEWKSDIVSLVIDGKELIHTSDEEVSNCIGKPLCRKAWEFSDIDMMWLH